MGHGAMGRGEGAEGQRQSATKAATRDKSHLAATREGLEAHASGNEARHDEYFLNAIMSILLNERIAMAKAGRRGHDRGGVAQAAGGVGARARRAALGARADAFFSFPMADALHSPRTAQSNERTRNFAHFRSDF